MASWLRSHLRKLKFLAKKTSFRLSGAGKPVERKVLFESFRGKTYSDNPRAVSEALHGMDPTIDIVWALNGQDEYGIVPSYIRTVTRDSSDYRRELATSAVFVTNETLEPYISKRKGKQLFVQTWHGDRAFKKILYDVWADRKRPDPIMDEFLTDFCIAGSAYGVHQFRSAFNYQGEIVLEGTPRDDCLCSPDPGRIAEVKQRLKFRPDQRLLLYAPTMRRANQSARTDQPIQGIDLNRILTACEKAYGGEWACLLRAHPIITGLSGFQADGKKIIDVSGYPDMTDLLLISDCLVTDYSSCAGDFALLGRPLFLFQDDIEEYQKKDRDFYFNMDDSPYFAAHSTEELEEIIAGTSLEDAAANCKKILTFYETKETGRAAETVARRIRDFCSHSER